MKKETNIYLADSYKARVELATAIAKIQVAAVELTRPDLTEDEAFVIAWSLGRVGLMNLEEYRCIR